jgi:hypothetical protein
MSETPQEYAKRVADYLIASQKAVKLDDPELTVKTVEKAKEPETPVNPFDAVFGCTHEPEPKTENLTVVKYWENFEKEMHQK